MPRSLRARLPGPVPVRVDPDRLGQIVANYLSNALRYSAEGSTVEVRVGFGGGVGLGTGAGIGGGAGSGAGHGAEVAIAVRDRGPGLTPDQAALVFGRFYRIDPSRSRALGGSGIGLAIARALAEAMDGRVWVESAGPGTGSTFGVALPAQSGKMGDTRRGIAPTPAIDTDPAAGGGDDR